MAEERRATRIIRCPSCGRYYRIAGSPPAPGTRLRCTKCEEVFVLGTEGAAVAPAAAPAATPAARAPARARGRVLVATDGPEFQALIAEVLGASGLELRAALDGAQAWEAIRDWRPHVALLDVALGAVPAFELCDRVRADAGLAGTGVILIASVFQRTRYKRAPTSLYGADDYVEKHHIRDQLPVKVAHLLPPGAVPAGPPAAARLPARTPPGGAPPRPEAAPAAARAADRLDERERRTLMREEVYGPRAETRQNAERLRENLRRYARIIVSDIALYNQDLVERGIREGSFYQLLKGELEEGKRLYLTRVPPAAAAPSEEYWQEAVRSFVDRRSAPGGGEASGKGRRGDA